MLIPSRMRSIDLYRNFSKNAEHLISVKPIFWHISSVFFKHWAVHSINLLHCAHNLNIIEKKLSSMRKKLVEPMSRESHVEADFQTLEHGRRPSPHCSLDLLPHPHRETPMLHHRGNFRGYYIMQLRVLYING